MKKVVLPLLLTLLGTGAYAQTRQKTKTPAGKTTSKVVTHNTTVQERVIDPGNADETIVEIHDGTVLVNGEVINMNKHGKTKVVITNPRTVPSPSPVSTAGTTAGPVKLGVFAVDDENGGALIQHVVANSPADLAGLKTGDVIVKINNQIIGNAAELMATMTTYQRGDQVAIYVERSNRPMTAIVNLGAVPSSSTATTIEDMGTEEAPSFSSSSTYAGELPRHNLYNDERMVMPYGKALGIRGQEVNRGIKVTAVRLGSPADKAGLRTGDIITRLDGERIWYSDDLDRVLRRSGESAMLEFLRHNTLYTTEVKY